MAPWSVHVTTLTHNLAASKHTHFGVEDGDKYVPPKLWYATASLGRVTSTGTNLPVFHAAKIKSPPVSGTSGKSPVECRPRNWPCAYSAYLGECVDNSKDDHLLPHS